MCAQFGIDNHFTLLAELYNVKPSMQLSQMSGGRYLPYSKAPVIMAGESEPLVMKLMNFSLVPSWSKTPKVKFATHNARLETIAEKPTWKKPFVSQRCLVPMTYFVEPIYEGPHAGYMVKFFEKAKDVMTAAGIWDQWMDKETGEVLESFSIITDEPPEFIERMGHDRCPVFLKKEAFKDWVDPNTKKATELKEILNSTRESLEFSVENDRAMRPGWEKRK